MISEIQKETLLNEYPDLSGNDIVLQKEMYAHFGLLFFKFSLVEHSLINIMLYQHLGKKWNAGKIQNRNQWERQWDIGNERACKLSFGQLVHPVIKIQEFGDLKDELLTASKRRNYFAHNYFREEVAIYMHNEGIWHILWGFYEVGKFFEQLDDHLKPRIHQMCKRQGIPTPNEDQMGKAEGELKTEALEAIASGNPSFGWKDV